MILKSHMVQLVACFRTNDNPWIKLGDIERVPHFPKNIREGVDHLHWAGLLRSRDTPEFNDIEYQWINVPDQMFPSNTVIQGIVRKELAEGIRRALQDEYGGGYEITFSQKHDYAIHAQDLTIEKKAFARGLLWHAKYGSTV